METGGGKYTGGGKERAGRIREAGKRGHKEVETILEGAGTGVQGTRSANFRPPQGSL